VGQVDQPGEHGRDVGRGQQAMRLTLIDLVVERGREAAASRVVDDGDATGGSD
jgi:hypothetical protein